MSLENPTQIDHHKHTAVVRKLEDFMNPTEQGPEKIPKFERCFLAILLLTPIFLPTAVDIGISPVRFGTVLVCGLAVDACTPPVGNCLNVCSAISRMSIGKIFIGAMPFLAANVLIMILCIFFPEIVLWLPTFFVG